MLFYKSKVMILRTGFWIKDKQDSCRRSSNNKTSRGVSSLSFTNWAVWTQSMVSEREERISTVPQSLWLFDRTLLLIRIDTNLSVAIKYSTLNTFLIRWRFDWVIKDDENGKMPWLLEATVANRWINQSLKTRKKKEKVFGYCIRV